jgi:hypothetical protein
MTQPQGLSGEAESFLAKNAMCINPCSCCGRHLGYVKLEVDRTGMFDELPLYQYRLKDGRTATEIVQANPWSSGPMVFLKLAVSSGELFEWDRETIDDAI